MKKNANGSWQSTRPDDGNAFLRDTSSDRISGTYRASDADSFGEELICAATMGESVSEDAMDEVSEEEEGGPFIVLDDQARFALLADDDAAPSSSFIDDDTHKDSVQRESITRAALWVSRN